MAYSVADLKKLAVDKPAAVTFTKEVFDVPGSEDFFTKVGGKLTITRPVVDVEARTVQGAGSLAGGSACPFQVTFVEGDSGRFTGVVLVAAAPRAELEKTFPGLGFDALERLGFTAAIRVVAAVPKAGGQAQVVDEAGLRFSMRGPDLRWMTLTFLVEKSGSGEYVVTGDFGADGLGLADLSLLTALPGMDGVGESQLRLPQEMRGVWDRLPTLAGLRVAFRPDTGVRSVWIDVKLLDEWKTDYFQLKDIRAQVTVGPRPAGADTTGRRSVELALSGKAVIRGVTCDVDLGIPSLTVTTTVSKTDGQKQIGEHLKGGDLPGGSPDLVMLRWDLRAGSFLFLGHLGTPWSAGDLVTVKDVVCLVGGGYREPIQASFTGRVDIGETKIGLTAGKAADAVTVSGTLDRLDLAHLGSWTKTTHGAAVPASLGGLVLRRVAADLAVTGDQRWTSGWQTGSPGRCGWCFR
jgi:hypothetical protein